MTRFQKYKLYLKTLIKYYFTKYKNASWLMVLSVFVLVWLWLIVYKITSNSVFSADGSGLVRLANTNIGLWVLFVKPVFVYVAGLVIIKKIDNVKKYDQNKTDN